MKKFAIVIAITLTTAWAGWAASGHALRMHGLSFSVTPEFSAFAEAGLDAVRSVFPAGAKPGAETMSIIAVRFPADAVGAGGMSDAELLDYVKATFLATTAVGKPVERTFLSRKLKGEAFAKSIPAPAQAEVYVVPLTSGDKVVLGFAFTVAFAMQARQVIGEVAASLCE